MLSNADKVRKYCSFQDRCIQEVRYKMRQLKMSTREAESLLKELLEEKFVDEDRFVESFIRGKININRWGKQKIRFELQMRGIDTQLISEKMSEIDEETYQSNIDYLVRNWYHDNPTGDRVKLLKFMYSKGYQPHELNNKE